MISSSPRAEGLSEAAMLDDLVVVEVEAGDGVARLGLFRLFFQADGAARAVELNDAVALRVFDRIGEDGGACFERGGRLKLAGEALAVEDVVAENQALGDVADEVVADEEGLR